MCWHEADAQGVRKMHTVAEPGWFGGLWVQVSYVEMLRSTGRALMAIVNDNLELSRIESGTVSLTETPFTLDGCVRNVLDLVYGRAWSVTHRAGD
jgi:signal transduction histidine kinase